MGDVLMILVAVLLALPLFLGLRWVATRRAINHAQRRREERER